jgi:hypothetical protein
MNDVQPPYTTRNVLPDRYDRSHSRTAQTELALKPEQQQVVVDGVEGGCQIEKTDSRHLSAICRHQQIIVYTFVAAVSVLWN